MMNRMFNSEYEFCLRIILILNTCKNFNFSLERIVYYDLMATYAKEFNIDSYNLHGDNVFAICEISSRRSIIKSTLTKMVKNGLVGVLNSKNGIFYNDGNLTIQEYNKLVCPYSSEYISNVKKIHSLYSAIEDLEFIKMISKALEDIRYE